MTEKRTYSINDLPKDETDLSRVKKMTERQINKAAKLDIDAKPLTKKQLAQFKRVHAPSEVNVGKIRAKLRLSQELFAAYFGVSKRTLQDWEQGKRIPSAPARVLLTIIAKKPQLVQDVLISK